MRKYVRTNLRLLCVTQLYTLTFVIVPPLFYICTYDIHFLQHSTLIMLLFVPLNQFLLHPRYSRKSSNTLPSDQFHQATSAMLLFQTMLSQDTNCFYALATNYVLSGRSFSEMCEHNASVAKDFGKSNVSKFKYILVRCSYRE